LLECLSKSELFKDDESLSESTKHNCDNASSTPVNLPIDFQWKPNPILKNKDKYFEFVIRDKDSYWIFKRRDQDEKQDEGSQSIDCAQSLTPSDPSQHNSSISEQEKQRWLHYEQLGKSYKLKLIHGLIDHPAAMLFFKNNNKYTSWKRLFARHFLCQQAEIELTEHKCRGFLTDNTTQAMSSEVLTLSSNVKKRKSRGRSSDFSFSMGSLTANQSDMQAMDMQKNKSSNRTGSVRIELEKSEDGVYHVIQRSKLLVRMAELFSLDANDIEEGDGHTDNSKSVNNPRLFTIHGAEFSTHQMARPFFADCLFFLKRKDGKDIRTTYSKDSDSRLIQNLEVWRDAEHLWSRMVISPTQKYVLDSRRLYLFYLVLFSLLFQSMRDEQIEVPVLHFHQKRQWIFEREAFSIQVAAYRTVLSQHNYSFKGIVFVGKNDKDCMWFSQIFDQKLRSSLLCPVIFIRNKNPLEVTSELCRGTNMRIGLVNDGQYRFGTAHAFDPPTIPRDHDAEFETFLAHFSSAFFALTPELNPQIFEQTHQYTHEGIIKPLIGGVPEKDMRSFLEETLQFMLTIEK